MFDSFSNRSWISTTRNPCKRDSRLLRENFTSDIKKLRKVAFSLNNLSLSLFLSLYLIDDDWSFDIL